MRTSRAGLRPAPPVSEEFGAAGQTGRREVFRLAGSLAGSRGTSGRPSPACGAPCREAWRRNDDRRKNRDVMLDRRRADLGDDSIVIMGTIVARRRRVAVARRRCRVGTMKAARAHVAPPTGANMTANNTMRRTPCEPLMFTISAREARASAGNFRRALRVLVRDMIAAVTGCVALSRRRAARWRRDGRGLLAEDTRLGRQVALKFLSPTLASDPDSRSRPERSARRLRPSIPRDRGYLRHRRTPRHRLHRG